MKKLNYTSPEFVLVEVSSADVITASGDITVNLDGTIELKNYGFSAMGMDIGDQLN